MSTFLNSYAQNMGPRPSDARCCAYSRFWISWLINISVCPDEEACQRVVSAAESSNTCSADTAATANAKRARECRITCNGTRHGDHNGGDRVIVT